jgi:hypothetical protein
MIDHVSDRPREVPQDFCREAFLLLDKEVRPVSTETLLSLGTGQPLIGLRVEFREYVRDRQLFEVRDCIATGWRGGFVDSVGHKNVPNQSGAFHVHGGSACLYAQAAEYRATSKLEGRFGDVGI